MRSAELYDPSAGTWSATGSMLLAREQHTATLLTDGDVLVAGGLNQGGFANGGTHPPMRRPRSTTPTTGTWAATVSMAEPHYGHTATLLTKSGWVLVAGGAHRRPRRL